MKIYKKRKKEIIEKDLNTWKIKVYYKEEKKLIWIKCDFCWRFFKWNFWNPVTSFSIEFWFWSEFDLEV